MKCLSVRQPFAALLVGGFKEIETRSWMTKYTGPLLIHASLRVADLQDDFRTVLARVPASILEARGVILGRVTLINCRPLRAGDRALALCAVDPSRYGWVVADPLIFPSFVKLKGKLGLFEVPDFHLPGQVSGSCLRSK